MIELGRAGRERWLLYQASIGSPVYDILAARGPSPSSSTTTTSRPAALLRDWEPAVAYEVGAGPRRSWPGWRRRAASPWPTPPSTSPSCWRSATRARPSSRCSSTCTSKSDEPDPALAAPLAAAQGARGRGRPAVRGEDLAAQGTARPGEDARRPAPHLRPGGPPAPGRLAARRDVRAGAARVHRRARAGRGREPAGLGVSGAELEAYFRAADVFVMASDHEGFCVPLAEAMGHGVPDRRLRRHGGARDGRRRGAGAARQVAGAVRRRRGPGARATRSCARCWRRPGRERAAGFDLAASTQRFVSLVQEAVGA